MAWNEIKIDDGNGLQEFVDLLRPLHARYADLQVSDVQDIMTKSKDCGVWIDRELGLGILIRHYPINEKGKIHFIVMPNGMDKAVALKHFCQVMSSYSSRNDGRDIYAMVPKAGCAPHMAEFYAYATSNISGSTLSKETDKSTQFSLPKTGVDAAKEISIPGDLK